MRLDSILFEIKRTIFIGSPFISIENEFPNRFVKNIFCLLVVCCEGYGKTETGFMIKDKAFIKVLNLCWWHNIDIFFRQPNISLLISVSTHNDKNKDCQKGPHAWLDAEFIPIKIHMKSFTKWVHIFDLFRYFVEYFSKTCFWLHLNSHTLRLAYVLNIFLVHFI